MNDSQRTRVARARHDRAVRRLIDAMAEVFEAAMARNKLEPHPSPEAASDPWIWATKHMTTHALMNTLHSCDAHGLSHEKFHEIVSDSTAAAFHIVEEARTANRGSAS